MSERVRWPVLEVRREGRRSFVASLLVNALFFGLGVLVTVLLT